MTERILEKSNELFLNLGFKSVTMDDTIEIELNSEHDVENN